MRWHVARPSGTGASTLMRWLTFSRDWHADATQFQLVQQITSYYQKLMDSDNCFSTVILTTVQHRVIFGAHTYSTTHARHTYCYDWYDEDIGVFFWWESNSIFVQLRRNMFLPLYCKTVLKEEVCFDLPLFNANWHWATLLSQFTIHIQCSFNWISRKSSNKKKVNLLHFPSISTTFIRSLANSEMFLLKCHTLQMTS